MRRALPLSIAVLFAACGSEPLPGPADAALTADDARAVDAAAPDAAAADAAAPDADPIDTGPPDLGVLDAGSTFHEASCTSGCPDSCGAGLCVRANNVEFCVDRCDTDRDGCLAGFSCVDITSMMQTVSVCVPPAAVCSQLGVGFGTDCFGDTSLCMTGRTNCQGDRLGLGTGTCTDGCFADLDCPEGYSCLPGDDGNPVCIPRWGTGAERCGQESLPGETACSWDGDCTENWWCVGAAPGRTGVCGVDVLLPDTCGADQTIRVDEDGTQRCVPSRCACRGAIPLPAGTRDLLGEALDGVGLDRCTAIQRVAELVNTTPDVLGDPYRFSAVTPLLGEPWRIPGWANGEAKKLDGVGVTRSAAGRAASIMAAMAPLGDAEATARPLEPVDPMDPLTDAVVRFATEAGGRPDRAAIALDAADVPPALQLAMATIVEGARQGLKARAAAFAGLRAGDIRSIYDYGPAFVTRRADGFGLSPAQASVRTLLSQTIKYGEFARGAVTVLESIDASGIAAFADRTATATVATSTATFLFAVDTPAGRIAIGGPESGIYDERVPGFGGAWAVLVDLGGSDTYRIAAGGNVAVTNPVSVLVDLGGRDRYGYVEVPSPLDGPRLVSDAGGRYEPVDAMDGGPVSLSEVPRQGGARAGVATVVDLGGDDDRYLSLRLSQGAAAFGAGVLVDDGGDDEYRAEIMAQGAAAFGFALQLDLGGRDVRSAYEFAQGFAFARGIGVAIDVAGDDRWEMDVGDPALGGDPMYPSAQRPLTSNASLGQGFAFGRRADFSDRAFMSGGIGVLIDGAGDDVYRACVFAQGGGFWFGTGILADRGGADRYDGLWYVTGAGAHYAIGVLLEGGGDDVYGRDITPINVTLGGGHDWSSAFLVDESGNDDYRGSRITLGSGNANGIGWLIDNGGDDHYDANSPTYALGAAGLLDMDLRVAGSSRRKVDTIGVFIDAGGRDDYRAMTMPLVDAADDHAWTRAQSAEPEIAATERGTGLDGTGDSTIHAR